MKNCLKRLISIANRFWKQHDMSGGIWKLFIEKKNFAAYEGSFTLLGRERKSPENLTGFIVCIDSGRPLPEVLILGEMTPCSCAQGMLKRGLRLRQAAVSR